MKAYILNVGTEVLTGKVINTNSAHLAKELSKIGITTEKVVVIGDDKQHLKEEVEFFLKSDCDILITTGGLGPTHDDFTKEVVCEVLGLELVLHEAALSVVRKYYQGIHVNADYAKCNEKQAYFPKDAMLIENKLGTADGAIMEYHNKTVIILVGPPHENVPMIQDGVIPYLQQKSNQIYLYKEFILMGQSESSLEDMLLPLYNKYPSLEIAPYESLGKIRFQITANQKEEYLFHQAIHDFRELLASYIISETLEEIEEVVVNALIKRNYHISFAESCTGGMLASKIINVSGASRVLNESFVTYSNEAKMKYLHVAKSTLDAYGAVSDEVVKEMVEGLFHQSKSEVAIAISGIAGPDGGTMEKPVGLVKYAIKIKEQLLVEEKRFRGNREMVRTRTTLWILYRLFTLLKNDSRS